MTDRLRSTQTDLASLRRHIERELAALDWPTPFDLGRLLDQIGTKRGKPISLFPAELPADGPGGLVIERADDLVIVFDEHLPLLQQEHIILHEAAHVLFGHRGTTVDDISKDGLSELDPELVEEASRFAQRDGYSGIEEKVAEVAAALMWLRVGATRSMVTTRVSSPEVAAVNERFAAALVRHGKTR